MSQASRRSEVGYINGAPSTPGYLLARHFCRNFRMSRGALQKLQRRKTNQTGILNQIKKRTRKQSTRFKPKTVRTMDSGKNPAEPTYGCGLRIFRNPSELTTQRPSPQYGKAKSSKMFHTFCCLKFYFVKIRYACSKNFNESAKMHS